MRILTLSALIALAFDQLSKLAVVDWLDLATRGEIAVAPPWLVFRMGWNRGINFGLLSSEAELARWALVLLALGVSAWLIRHAARHRLGTISLICAGLIVGGAAGNALDRVINGAVADFLNMSCCGLRNPFVFNLADVFIFAGVFGLALFGANPRRHG